MSFGRWQDLRPAFLCSEAVLIDKNADVAKYLNKARDKYPMDIQFDKVHVSEDDACSVKFLVAYGREATFIAFRGARDFGYLGRDREKQLTSRGLHATVSQLVDSFLIPDSKLLAELCRSGKRIIFCGHRLGGAVAQMVTFDFWKPEKTDSTKAHGNPDPLIAISFGAPQIWDSQHVQAFTDDADLKKRFLNVSNAEDPLRSLLKDGLQVPLPDPKSPTFGTQVSGKFFSAGSHCVPGKFVKPWNETKFIECYKSTVEDVLKQVEFFVPNATADQPRPKIVVLSPAPQVQSASRKASDSGSFITIRGSNLLFLREKVKLNGLHPWDTVTQTDENIRIFSPEKTKPSEDVNNSVSKVVIRTAFGGTSHDVSEGNKNGELNEEPLKLLSRIVQTYYMLGTPGPFWCPASDEELADLDGIVKCAQDSIEDDEKPFSTLFRERAKACPNIGEMNALVQKVTDFLDTSYEIHYKRDYWTIMGIAFGGALVEAGLILIPLGGVALAAAGVATIAGTVTATVTGGVAAVGGSSVMAVSLSPKKLMLEKYSDMLKLAIHEASLWNHSAPNPDPKLPLADLEFLLQQEVERTGSKFDRMLVDGPKARHIIFQSRSHLKHATLESKRHFFRRMHIVAKTVELYHKKVKNIEFLGLVGEEDAGKSTFIKNVIERLGAPQDSGVPQVGIDYHTNIVTPYKLTDQFYLVDFPGSNGTEKYADAWLQFTELPSSCILLLDFKGDIKKEQVQTYKEMQKSLDSKIAVVFNKVDQLYTPKQEKVYHAKYFEDHRRKSAELLGCSEKYLYYVCLDPDPEERLTKLQAVGVLGFEDLAYKLGEWLDDEHSVSESHRVLKDMKTPETNGSSRMGLYEPQNATALTDDIS